MDEQNAEGVSADYEVVIVGGGPAGCSAGVFTARCDLSTAIFDRGNSAFRRCAYLENYLGFPGGIGVDTFYGLMHAHAEEAGCEIISDMVTAVNKADEDSVFVVETQDGRTVTTMRVLAATWYDGEYLRPLGGDAMFERHDHGGEEHEHFDPEYSDEDGRTPVDGLYVASPNGERSAQTIVAAGHGAHVARSLFADYQRDQGYPDGVTDHYDWLRRESEFSGDWAHRDRWREYYEHEADDNHDLSDERFVELREQYIDRAFETSRSTTAVERRSKEGLQRFVDEIGTDQILDALDDDVIYEYAANGDLIETDHD